MTKHYESFSASIYFLPLKKKDDADGTDLKHKKDPKTRDILRNLYPSLSEEVQEQKSAEAIYKLVTYDPLSVPALENFQVIQQSSQCTFARKAKIWGTPPWNAASSIGEFY